MKNELKLGKAFSQRIKTRKKEGISLGKVSSNVIRVICDAIVSSETVGTGSVNQINTLIAKTNWGDTGAISRAFKQITAILEQEMRVPA